MTKISLSFFFIFLFTLVGYGQNFTLILGRPTDKTVTISVLFDQNTDYFIEYGTTTGVYGKTTLNFAAKSNVPDEIDLTGLTVNTKYYYRVQ